MPIYHIAAIGPGSDSKDAKIKLQKVKEIPPMNLDNTCHRPHEALTILVADDNEINRALIQRILEKAGYRVDMVDNGRRAVEFSNQTQYDLILMDIQMPLMDGYEATKIIRKAEESREAGIRNGNEVNSDSNSTFPIPHSEIRNPKSPIKPVPIIALTGNNPESEIEKCRRLGMNDCIGKPLFREPLLSLINQWTSAESIGPDTQHQEKNDKKSSPDVPESCFPIDLDRALNEFLGEKDVLYGLLKGFTIKVRSQINAIRQAVLNQDFKVIAQEAHSIKGGAANLTADTIAGVSANLEKAAEQKQLENVSPLVTKLEEELQQLESYLQKKVIAPFGEET
jgi:CheY-like chemotaxis protein/HPt (histidine-containing phosphotransfer) domain-containing protein